MSIEIVPLTQAIGAEISGLDLSKPLRDEDSESLHKALLDHLVVFFRDQSLSPESHLALARSFGELDAHAFGRHVPGYPDLGLLEQTEPQRDGSNRWHTDSTFMPQPPKYAVLRAVELPPNGGDTCWASMYAAFELLSPPIQRALEEMTACHDISGPLIRAIEGGHSVGDLDAVREKWPTLSHPVVCRHPETGRKCLYVNSNFTTHIEGVSDAESEAILAFLHDWVASPEIQVRFQWEPGSVALWDNRCTQHYAVSDYREKRVMHRVTIAGDWTPSQLAAV